MDDVCNNTDYYSLNRNRKILIAFDDMIAHTMTNKKCQAITKNYLLDAGNWICLLFLSNHFIFVFQEVGLNSTYYLLIKTHNKR